MAKDLEKCRLIEKTYQTTSFNFDAILEINVKLFQDLETQQAERLQLEKKLETLNKAYNKALKSKKQNWLLPGTVGLVLGVGVMLVL